MKRIIGRVLVKETGAGIPDLVVGAFDHDRDLPQRGERPTVERLGDRLGSVLTDTLGNFAIDLTDCAPAGGSSRPDLMLAVFAPEDSMGLQHPAPTPAEQRLLHVSCAPRVHAGHTEAYVIRILQEQLDRFRISTSTDNVSIRDVEAGFDRFASSIERNRAARDRARARMTSLLGPRLERLQCTRAEAKSKVAGLSTMSRAKREAGLFVPHRGAIREAQSAAIEEGLARLRNHDEPFTIRGGKGRIFMSDGATDAVLPVARIEQGLSEMTGGLDLVRRRTLVDACRRPDTVSSVDPVVTPTPGVEPATASPPTNEQLAAEIRARVLGQIEGLPTGGLEKRPTMREVQASIESLELKGGPADVVSFHDFHVLQVAFRHVWTQAFDKSLSGTVEKMYEEYARLYDEAGLTMPPVGDLDEIEKVTEFAAEVRSTIGAGSRPSPAPDSPGPSDVPSDVGVNRSGGLIVTESATTLDASPEFEEGFPELVWVWPYLSPSQQEIIDRNAKTAQSAGASETERSRARGIVRSVAQHPDGSISRLQKLLLELSIALAEPYAFDVFAADSFNYGVMLTYRQKWTPETYQAGELVATVPLAPGESRKYTKRKHVKQSRAVKEVERAMSSRSLQSSEVARAEAEIMKKVTSATNFKLTAEGSFNVGIGSIKASSEFGGNSAQDSRSTRRDFHESTLRAAEEYKQERTLEVDTAVTVETDETESGEISNPNNELTVTYLFYELERRYRIAEHLQRARAVILVAQDVPAPHEIDEAWLLQYQWILSRVLLDDSFRAALGYLSSGLAGDEVSISVVRARWEAQRDIVRNLEASVSQQILTRDSLRKSLIDTVLKLDRSKAAEMPTVFKVFSLGMSVDPAEKNAEMLEAARHAAETRLEYTEQALADAQRKLTHASDAFESATRDYTAALQNQYTRRVSIDQLRIHVKQNILYYMQAIWDHEPPDQRFFRLYKKKVSCPHPKPEATGRVVELPGGLGLVLPLPDEASGEGPMLEVHLQLGETDPKEVELVEIADLDSPLGYKGNYIIFPLKRPCHLSTFMLRQYIDEYFGVRDPDELGNYTIEELDHYVKCVHEQGTRSEEELKALREYFTQRITEDRPESDTIIVPTGQLFIEALPGRHPLLEDFKLRHRMEDVRKVQTDIRHTELENLRLAARLATGDAALLEDPDIEKRIVVDKGTTVVDG